MHGRTGVRAWATVDEEDYERISKFRWNLASTGRPVRLVPKADRERVGASSQYMGIEVMGKPPEGKWVQYVSKDRLDCRKENLRIRLRYKDVWGEVNGWRKYGMDRERYERMLEAQGGVCAICKKPPEEKVETRVGTGGVPVAQRKLHVDHNHTTGEVRELLCWSCNIGLGKFEDNPDFLLAAAEYLAKHNPFALSS